MRHRRPKRPCRADRTARIDPARNGRTAVGHRDRRQVSMIKLLSVKTRREGSTREAFRKHYEERHVPLGLGFIDRFRWRKYVRNHVLEVRSGRGRQRG